MAEQEKGGDVVGGVPLALAQGQNYESGKNEVSGGATHSLKKKASYYILPDTKKHPSPSLGESIPLFLCSFP